MVGSVADSTGVNRPHRGWARALGSARATDGSTNSNLIFSNYDGRRLHCPSLNNTTLTVSISTIISKKRELFFT